MNGVKIIRGAGTTAVWSTAFEVRQEVKRVTHHQGDDGKKYRHKYNNRKNEDGTLVTTQAVYAGTDYIKDACTSWLEQQNLPKSERGAIRWNRYSLTHHLKRLMASNYQSMLRKAVSNGHGILFASTVDNVYDDRHVRVYEITERNTGWMKSWKRKFTITPEDAKGILAALRTNEYLIKGTLGKLEDLQAHATYQSNLSEVVRLKQEIEVRKHNLAAYDMVTEQAKYDAQNKWADEMPEHLTVQPAFWNMRQHGWLTTSPQRTLEAKTYLIKTHTDRLERTQKQVDAYIMIHGAEEVGA